LLAAAYDELRAAAARRATIVLAACRANS